MTFITRDTYPALAARRARIAHEEAIAVAVCRLHGFVRAPLCGSVGCVPLAHPLLSRIAILSRTEADGWRLLVHPADVWPARSLAHVEALVVESVGGAR